MTKLPQQALLQGIDRNWYPLELTFDHNPLTDYTLKLANQQMRLTQFQQSAHHNQAIAWQHWLSKSDFFQSAEANRRISEKLEFVRTVTARLSYRFKHDNAGH